MEDLGRVHILEPAQQLVEEELVVLRREVVVGLDDLVQIRLHQLEDHVDVPELPRRRRQHDVLDVDDVGVAQQAQQLDLAQDARRVRDVVESGDNLHLTGFNRERHPSFGSNLQAGLDGISDVGKGLIFRGTLVDAAGYGGTLDHPNAVFVTVDRHNESHGIISTQLGRT